MSIRNWKKGAGAVALVLALAVPALADDDDDRDWRHWGYGQMMMMGGNMGQWGMGGPMMGRWGGMGGPMMGYGPDAMLDRIDGRLAFIKTELKITEAQNAAWDELAGAIRTTAGSHNDMMRSMMEEFESGALEKMTLPDRLTLQETHLGARLEEVKTLKAALEKLYAVLDDDQKAAADEIVLPTMGMGMGRMRGYGPGRMMRQ